MAVLTATPQEPTPEQPKKPASPKITPESYKGSTVDTKYTSQRSLLTHIDGSPWRVKYYQQALGASNEPSSQQVGKHAVYQQYIEIADFEIMVTDPLTQQQDTESKSFEVRGSAVLYPPVIPNTGDTFLADIGDGREGVFSITMTERMTILKESTFRIEYVLVDYADDTRRRDLEKKTIKHTHFIKRLLEHGEDPIVVNEEYRQYLSLEEYQGTLTAQYFGDFYQRSMSTLAVPDQDARVYDPFVVKAIKAVFDTYDHPMVQHIKAYSAELPDRDLPMTIWDCMLRFSTDMLPLINEKLALVGSYHFGIVPQYEGVYFSNVEQVVYPVGLDGFVPCERPFQQGRLPKGDIQHQFTTTFLGSFDELGKTKPTGISALPSIHPITKDDYYVFSEAFYRRRESGMSQLESLVHQALDGSPVDRKTLIGLCDEAVRWRRLEKFYYIPMLLILLKMARIGN